MPKVIDTGILSKSYNSRGLVTHNSDTRALVRQTNGTLWAAVFENMAVNPITLLRSTDDGFSWTAHWRGNFTSFTGKVALPGGDNNTNGYHLSLQVYEHSNRIILWASYVASSTGIYSHECFVWSMLDPTVLDTTTGQSGSLGGSAFSLALDVPYNDSKLWMIYTAASGVLTIKQCSLQLPKTPDKTVTQAGLFFDLHQGVAHRDGYVDIAILEDNTTSYALRHIRFDSLEGTFGAKHTIYDFGHLADAADVGIARDGYNNLCVVWAQETASGDNLDTYFSISRGAGASWNAPTKIVKEIGHSAYRDPATARLAARATVMGGHQGFMIGYTQTNPDVIAKTFVRTLLTTDGETYSLGEQREIATQGARAAEPVTGLRWFRPPAATLLDIGDPGLVRVAYQVGEGNSRIGADSVAVRFGQELLYQSAFPSSLASNTGSYVTQGPLGTQVPVSFNILGAPNENVNYYALGVVGRVTSRYLAAFNKVGTEYRLQRFDPVPEAEMSDRSAYAAPVEFTSLAILDAHSYEFPTLNQRGTDDYNTAVERDVRRIYLPPNFHLSRDFILNSGNFLKRTVWIVSFASNEYELTQVIPYFIDGQIGYYAANAYVVGPSNDPFSRRILPSEM